MGSVQAGIYLALLTVFIRSLQPEKMPLITRLALLIRGELPPDLQLYTRQVTMLWTIFFAAQLLISLLLFLFAPRVWWLIFITFLNMPLVVLMFGMEYGFRRWRFPHYRHDSWQDIRRIPQHLRSLLLASK